MSCPWWSPAFFSCLFMKNLWKNRKCGWTHGAASHLFHVKLHPTLTSNVDTSISTNWWICEGILSQGMWIQWFGQKISPKLLPSQASRLLSVLNMKLESLNTHTSPPSSQSQEHSSWIDFFLISTLNEQPPLRLFTSRISTFYDSFLAEKKFRTHFWKATLSAACSQSFRQAIMFLLYLLLPLHTNQGSHKSIAPLLDLVGKLGTPSKKMGNGWIPHTKKTLHKLNLKLRWLF